MDEDPEEERQRRPLLRSGHDEEAVIDQRSSSLLTQLEDEELEGHRAEHVVLHVPLDREGRKNHRRHRTHHRRRRKSHKENQETDSDESPAHRVHFILGSEDNDEEHHPHELYIQLDELVASRSTDTLKWKETARWLKFEEDVEDGGERWSKPYVSTLPLHSLNQLRLLIHNGTVLLDMSAGSMSEITDLVVERLVASGQLDQSLKDTVRETLMRKHHHQSEMKLSNRLPLVRSFADIGKKHSDPHLLEKNGLLAPPQAVPGTAESNSSLDLTRMDLHFMKKLPPGAEACNVLVGQVDFLQSPVSAFVRLTPSVLLSELTEVPIPTRFLFLLLGPSGRGTEYHEIGRSISAMMIDEVFHDVAYKARSRGDLLAGVDEFLDAVIVLPPGEWDPAIRIEPPKSVPSQMKRKMPPAPNGAVPDPDGTRESEHQPGPELQRTGRVFGGLLADVKRKRPFYWSDLKDGLSLQCLASVLFLYCACMSPVITFGGLLGEATNGNISAIESLFGASLTGMAYSLFAGQPLTILGSTGPILVFEKILFKFCSDFELEYLPFRTSIGLWTAFFCLLLVATDASSLVCFITRFTEEAFAALISLIFIYEALEKLVHLGEAYPYNPYNPHTGLDNHTHLRSECVAPRNISPQIQELWRSENLSVLSIPWSQLGVQDCSRLGGVFRVSAYVPDVLFWSVILFFSTFILSNFLKQLKTQRYFPTKVRSTISDFAVFLTILLMVLVDFLVGVPSPKLQVPERFQPTSPHRGWVISPLGENPWWSALAATVPALLCTILIFMDQQITAVIVNRKENKLQKGCGYHLDLLIVSVMLAVCSVMGLPWFVAATVLSITHVNSLKQESAGAAPGEQPKFLGIREQRVTGFIIFFLMGCSVFMTAVLKFIPMPVLYGVFLYMGVSSLRGIQLFDRVKLFLMPPKHQPDLIYLRYVPLWKVHVFTAVQVTCLAALWVIKTSPAAVIFPMMVLALVFIRKLLDLCIFTKKDLSWLDDIIPESKKKKDDDKKKHRESLRQQQQQEEDVFRPQLSLRSRESLPAVEVKVEDELGQRAVDSETPL